MNSKRAERIGTSDGLTKTMFVSTKQLPTASALKIKSLTKKIK